MPVSERQREILSMKTMVRVIKNRLEFAHVDLLYEDGLMKEQNLMSLDEKYELWKSIYDEVLEWEKVITKDVENSKSCF